MIYVFRLIAMVVLLAVIAAVIAGLVMLRSKPPVKPPGDTRPVVRVAELQRGQVRIDVEATGTVVARGQTTFAAEVAGRVMWVAPGLEAGLHIDADSEVIRIEDVDYRSACERSAAILAKSRLALAQEVAQAAQARSDWQLLGEGDGTALALREPQLAAAKAQVAADEASLHQAERDLARTSLRIPTSAMVTERLVEVGQLVTRGQALLRVRDDQRLEAHLPVTIGDLTALGLSTTFADTAGPLATLHTADGRQAEGHAVRTTGRLDPDTRLATLVIELPGDCGLLPGDFITANLTGTTSIDGITLPRHLLRRDGSVLLIDENLHLLEFDAQVQRLQRNEAIIANNVPANLRLITSRLEGWSTGTEVRIAGENAIATEASAVVEEPKP